MKTTLKTLACLTTIGASTVIPQVARADSYINFTQNLGALASGATETGNQINFTGGNPSYNVTNFSVQVYGTFGAGDTVDIRFYNANGPAANGYSYTPSTTPLFNSGALDVSSIGANNPGAVLSITADGLPGDLPIGGVTVQPTMIFTIQFAGPDSGSEGVALFGPTPTDGANTSVVWEFDGPGQASGWTLVTNPPGTAPYNIGASIEATPEPTSLALFGLGAVALAAFGMRRRLAVR